MKKKHKKDITISKKKVLYPVEPALLTYLKKYDRLCDLPTQYEDLLHFSSSFPYINKKGQDTLWESLVFEQHLREELNQGLTKIYSLLKTAGNTEVIKHLYVDRIDYCTFGNSKPFRIRIKNQFNDNYDYFYIKQADSSRIYGLELEHILSPNRMNYLVSNQTLIEEHIAGIPGDQFIKDYMNAPTTNKVRVAKEFVKFNERCFSRLLGDMRSYNFVVDITPDFEDEQYRIRAIDFDQQCYEGNIKIYLPQFFKENYTFVNQCVTYLPAKTVKQYQEEERTLMQKRAHLSRYKLHDLILVMNKDSAYQKEKLSLLKGALDKHHTCLDFKACIGLGDVIKKQLKKQFTGWEDL